MARGAEQGADLRLVELLRRQYDVVDGRFPGDGAIIAEADGDRELWLGRTEPRTSLEAVARRLGVAVVDGPSYVLPDELVLASDVEVVTSGRFANPGGWEPVEWDELLAGRLGPWAMAVDGERVLSICHAPVPIRAEAAECGVWTDTQFRGRGLAPATVAAWIPLVRAPDRHLFYCTNRDNVASQRVAAKCGARPIGWTWRARRPPPAVHPLSSLAT